MTTPRTASTEDPRVTSARDTLKAARAAAVALDRTYDYVGWCGQLGARLEELLGYIDERAARNAALEAAARKPFDDLAATAAEIMAERGES